MTDHRSYAHNLSSCGIKAWKKFRPERGSNLFDTGAVLYQLSYQANRELVTLWARSMAVEGE